MFRPNRIGATNICQVTDNSNTAITTHAQNAWTNTDYLGRVINAAPVGDFAQSKLYWGGAASLSTLNRTFLGQQFTVTQPIQGNAVGLELRGGLIANIANSVVLIPFMAKLAAAGASVLASVTISADQINVLGKPTITNPGDDTIDITAAYYNETAVLQGDSATLPGTYVHGFMILNPGATHNTNSWNLDFAVRQLNDQQNVGYRDTRR